MMRPSLSSITRGQALAVLFAFVIVTSASGAATSALLSDRETVSVELSVEQSPVSAFHVQPVADCELATVEGEQNLKLAKQFDVEGEGCAKISVWVSKSWVHTHADDVDGVLIGHNNESGWTYFATTVVAEKRGKYKLEATTTGFSPFGLFVEDTPTATDSPGDATATPPSTANESGLNASVAPNGTNVTAPGSLNGSVENVTANATAGENVTTVTTSGGDNETVSESTNESTSSDGDTDNTTTNVTDSDSSDGDDLDDEQSGTEETENTTSQQSSLRASQVVRL